MKFLDAEALESRWLRRIEDLDKSTILRYIDWLHISSESGGRSARTIRTNVAALRTLMLPAMERGQLSSDCFPRRILPNESREFKPYEAYSDHEMRQIITALSEDLRTIRGGTFYGGDTDRLIVYFLMIAARTGRNTTPLLEMERGSVQPHPLKPATHSLLTTYKRRGNTVSVQSLAKKSDEMQLDILASDVGRLVEEVLQYTSSLVDDAPPHYKNRLWLFRRRLIGSSHRGIGAFSDWTIKDAGRRFTKRHGILADGGNLRSASAPLNITVMRLRKTFAKRMWELTGGDVLMTASLLGNTPVVTDSHYLAVTPSMMRNHHFLGRCLEIELRGTKQDVLSINQLASDMGVTSEEVTDLLNGRHNTGVGRCSSPLSGRFAPKDGHTPCSAFVHCFRCPNQVVMESDLHRLFSFYWLLVKERNLLGRNEWNKVYGWIIREVDRVIAPKFSKKVVEQAKASAFSTPHPMWRDRELLQGEPTYTSIQQS